MKAKFFVILIVLFVVIVAVLLVTDVIVITKPSEQLEESVILEEEEIEVDSAKEERIGDETVSGKLGLSNIVFCSENPNGYMDYEEQPEATFAPGDIVWIYFNLNGVQYNVNQDKTKEIWLKLHLTLKSPEGNIILDEDLYNEHKNFDEKYNLDEMFLRVNISTTEELAEGKYIVETILIDELADENAPASSSFYLKK